MIYDLIDLICKKIVLCNYNSKLFKYAMKSIKSKKKSFHPSLFGCYLFLTPLLNSFTFLPNSFNHLFTKFSKTFFAMNSRIGMPRFTGMRIINSYFIKIINNNYLQIMTGRRLLQLQCKYLECQIFNWQMIIFSMEVSVIINQFQILIFLLTK